MSFKTSETTVGSAVATSGTVTLSYPANTNAGSFAAFGHEIWVDKFQRLLTSPTDFTVSFGASDITVTYLGATTIPVGARVTAQLNILGTDSEVSETDFSDASVERTVGTTLVTLTLGAPDVLDVDGVCAAQAVGGAGALTLNGALVAGGVATFDVPRGVEIDSDNAGDTTQTITVTGTDEYGNVVVEDIAANGTTAVAGVKTFKTVTSVVSDAAFTGNATVGTTDVLGLPVFLPSGAYVIAELEDGAAATAGTLVAGVSSAATATTGDVRGTYDPNSATDGAKVFDLVVALPDPKYKGVAQFAG